MGKAKLPKLGRDSGYLGHFAKEKYLRKGHNDVVDTVKSAVKKAGQYAADRFDDAYVELGEATNRDAMTPEENAAARKRDPEFRKAGEEWDAYVQKVRARQQRERNQ